MANDFKLVRDPNKSDRFLPLEIEGGLVASIQASEYHYSRPRQTLPSSDDYEEFEVALIFNGVWFHPEKDPEFSKCSWSKNWSESDDVAGYVPRADVAKMIEDLRERFESSSGTTKSYVVRRGVDDEPMSRNEVIVSTIQES